tara:strand:- start:74 stop:268 length:195 start_codon:yes stop_codon:yes gene_type:complete
MAYLLFFACGLLPKRNLQKPTSDNVPVHRAKYSIFVEIEMERGRVGRINRCGFDLNPTTENKAL